MPISIYEFSLIVLPIIIGFLGGAIFVLFHVIKSFREYKNKVDKITKEENNELDK